ncbi:unnamed protein product [Acanthoscelides obtectus]|uniref:MADF domain-containing protein n=1 Tax=Acanthoscelides obtectus TaxID=200917 RepID=A0A9P0KMK8_ACAOB|nr:unnamed protein product [Acanthoscelides obtectus]CAK1672393.1 hypothetical protein AOBTE_LOCUS28853 [Acanthoscelides obtectus]
MFNPSMDDFSAASGWSIVHVMLDMGGERGLSIVSLSYLANTIWNAVGGSEITQVYIGNSLQQKWKGLRDGFVRELKRRKTTPSGSGAPGKGKYIYFERLMFLERSTRNKTTDSNINTTPRATEQQDLSGNGEDVTRPPVRQAKKKKKLDAADEEFLTIIKKKFLSRN